jgi:hypothetical protein
MISMKTNIQENGVLLSLESLNQSLTTASTIAIVLPLPTMEDRWKIDFPFGVLAAVPMTPIEYNPDLNMPRTPGAGKERILKVAHDFDAPLNW